MSVFAKDHRVKEIRDPMLNRTKQDTKEKSEYELLCEAAVELKYVISVLKRNADQLAAKVDEIQQERRADDRKD